MSVQGPSTAKGSPPAKPKAGGGWRDTLTFWRQAHRLAWSGGFKRYMLIAPGVAVLWILGGALLGALCFPFVSDWLRGLLPSWLSWLDSSWTGGAGAFMVFIVWMLLLLLTSQFAALVIVSPVFTWISEKTDRVNGSSPAHNRDSLREQCLDTLRSAVFSALLGVVSFAVWFSVLLVSWIPLVGFLVGAVAFLINAYLMGIALRDPGMERRGKGIPATLAQSLRNTGACLRLGIIYQMLVLVPLVGWVLAPIYGTIAGTLMVASEHRDPAS